MRRFRITRRRFFAAFGLAALAFISWIALEYRETRARRQVIETLGRDGRFEFLGPGNEPSRGFTRWLMGVLGQKAVHCRSISCIDQKRPPTEADMRALDSVSWPHLEEMLFLKAELWKDGELLLPRRCPRLNALKIWVSELPAEAWQHLSRYPNLTELQIDRSGLDEAGLDCMARLFPNLDSLYIREPVLKDIFPARLGGWPKLSTLKLLGADLRGGRIDPLCSLRNLEHVEFLDCRFDESISKLAACPKLEYVHLFDLALDGETGASFLPPPALTHMQMGHVKGSDPLLKALSKCPNLRVLEAWHCDATDMGFAALVGATQKIVINAQPNPIGRDARRRLEAAGHTVESPRDSENRKK